MGARLGWLIIGSRDDILYDETTKTTMLRKEITDDKYPIKNETFSFSNYYSAIFSVGISVEQSGKTEFYCILSSS